VQGGLHWGCEHVPCSQVSQGSCTSWFAIGGSFHCGDVDAQPPSGLGPRQANYTCIAQCTALSCTVLYCTVLYCTVLYCTTLYYIVLHYCTVLHCTVLQHTALYCTAAEEPFELDGPSGVIAYLQQLLEAKGHAVICVSEGAGQNLLYPGGRGCRAESCEVGHPRRGFIRTHSSLLVRGHWEELCSTQVEKFSGCKAVRLGTQV
jgi:hypothetical protein